MRIAGLWLVALSLSSLYALGACDLSPSRFRAQITVEVQTPNGVRSGSSVVEILAGKTLGLLPDEGKAMIEMHGEAVAVDLPGGQTLFALLRIKDGGDSMERVIMAALVPGFQGGAEGFLKGVAKLARPEMVGRSANLPSSSYPMFVRFRDILRPETVEGVDPDQLESEFGPGFLVRAIRIQITDSPISTGVEKRFRWWSEYLDRNLDGSSSISQNLTTDSPAARLTSRSFSTEAR